MTLEVVRTHSHNALCLSLRHASRQQNYRVTRSRVDIELWGETFAALAVGNFSNASADADNGAMDGAIVAILRQQLGARVGLTVADTSCLAASRKHDRVARTSA
jgi:hypothetical protein